MGGLGKDPKGSIEELGRVESISIIEGKSGGHPRQKEGWGPSYRGRSGQRVAHNKQSSLAGAAAVNPGYVLESTEKTFK